MSKKKRQNPFIILVATGRRLKTMLIPLIGMIAFGSRATEKELVSLAMSAITVIVIFFVSIFTWLRYTYRIEEEELRIEYGIFVKTKKYIPLKRIQSIDISEGLIGRMFGLVKVQIETAGGARSDEPEAVLTAISKKEARVLQDFVTGKKEAGNKAEEDNLNQNAAIVYKISMSQLILLSFTSGGIGVIVWGALAFLSQMDDFVHFNRLFGGFEKWAAYNMVVISFLLFIIFVLVWVAALISTILKYANFTVSKTEKELVIFRGLIERRQITIPLKRIQAIRINENLVRQLLGLAAVYVESAGGSRGNEEDAKVTILPIVKTGDIDAILGPVLTDYTFTHSFRHAPKRARLRYVLRSLYVTGPIVIAALIFLKQWCLLSFILLAISTVWALMKHRDACWSLDIRAQQLSLRFRLIVRTTLMMKKNKIQSLIIRESPFQYKRGLATVEAFVKSGSGPVIGEVIDLEQKDIEMIYRWYSPAGK